MGSYRFSRSLFGIIIGLVFAFTWSTKNALAQTGKQSPKSTIKPMEVKVLVLNFDPIVLPRTKVRLHEECRWNNPRELSKGYIQDIKTVSGGLIVYKIVDWKDLDEFPIKTDGFVYTMEEYLRCHKAGKGWHQPDTADYPKIIAKHKIVERIEKGEIDEVWWFGPPYTGFYESAMAGQGAFYINGGVFGADKVPCKRAFAIMGFNYERGVAEMIHDLCHRTESTMSRIFGGWKADQLDSDWAKFAANTKQSNGVAGVGNCHYPPNGEKDYDYANNHYVESSADDWLNYPNLKGTKKKVNCETWGGPDYQRNYLCWWFTRLPKAPGTNANSRLNNWWEYVFNFNAYDERGRPFKVLDPKIERKVAQWVWNAGGKVRIEDEKGQREIQSASDLTDKPFFIQGINLTGRPLKDGDLTNLNGLTRLSQLNLGGVGLGDKGLEPLESLDSLTWLSLNGNSVRGPGLARLKNLTRLNYLELNNLPLMDKGLNDLPPLPELRELHLTATPITDAGLKNLKNFPALSTLSLSKTAVTDKGLQHLTNLRGLTILFVSETKVTQNGINRLKQSIPTLDGRLK